MKMSKLTLIQGMNRAPESEVQATTQLIYKWLQTSLPMRDAVAFMMLAQTAMVWAQRPKDEDTVRKMMAEYTEGVVALWKKQTEVANEAGRVAADRADAGNA